MPQQIKPDPEKYCEQCGQRLARKRWSDGVLESLLHFGRRKFCNLECAWQNFRDRPEKEVVAHHSAHARARRIVSPGPCEICGKPDALDVYHKSGNWTDNSLENLMRVCRSCHIKTHRRAKSCVVCGKPQKGLGYCNMHYVRFKVTGDPLKTKIPPRKKCLACGEMANARGLCGKHYMQAKRAGTLVR